MTEDWGAQMSTEAKRPKIEHVLFIFLLSHICSQQYSITIVSQSQTCFSCSLALQNHCKKLNTRWLAIVSCLDIEACGQWWCLLEIHEIVQCRLNSTSYSSLLYIHYSILFSIPPFHSTFHAVHWLETPEIINYDFDIVCMRSKGFVLVKEIEIDWCFSK